MKREKGSFSAVKPALTFRRAEKNTARRYETGGESEDSNLATQHQGTWDLTIPTPV